MSLAILIASNEEGNNTVTTLAASQQEMKDALSVLATSHKRYNNIDANGQPNFHFAVKCLERAYYVMGENWERNNQPPKRGDTNDHQIQNRR